ncbi:MAG TPA: AraC family transcriptional regulator [Rhizobiaceae bacterium]|nr:AraC family transcriptional regulator [Rhizobiaceae bacterium]
MHELRGAVDRLSDYWCLVVSPCPAAGSILPDERPAGLYELFLQPLDHWDESAFGAASVLMMLFPTEMFIENSVPLEKARFRLPNTGLGALLMDYMLLLEQLLPTLSEDELQPPLSAARLLIGACLGGKSNNVEEAGRRRWGSRTQRAHQLIRENLHSPSFGEADIRRALGISRSSLYRLFASLGGVKRCIQRERLARARMLISDPLNEKPICKIAEELCFCDASSFSRAFRNEFGMSPRDVRGVRSKNWR